MYGMMMMMIMVATSLVFFASAGCPSGWVLYGTNCYKFTVTSGTSNTWTDCQVSCANLGASMLCVNNAAENEFIWSNTSPVWTWIGYQDFNTYPTFMWNSGCTSTYTNWSGGQPDHANGVEYYAHLWSTGTGQWNDAGNGPAQRNWWAATTVFGCSCQVALSAVSE